MEIKQDWKNIILRAQSMARKYDGTIIIQLTITVNGDGTPLFWLKPKIIPLEPRLGTNINLLKEKLSDEELQKVLGVIMHSV